MWLKWSLVVAVFLGLTGALDAFRVQHNGHTSLIAVQSHEPLLDQFQEHPGITLGFQDQTQQASGNSEPSGNAHEPSSNGHEPLGNTHGPSDGAHDLPGGNEKPLGEIEVPPDGSQESLGNILELRRIIQEPTTNLYDNIKDHLQEPPKTTQELLEHLQESLKSTQRLLEHLQDPPKRTKRLLEHLQESMSNNQKQQKNTQKLSTYILESQENIQTQSRNNLEPSHNIKKPMESIQEQPHNIQASTEYTQKFVHSEFLFLLFQPSSHPEADGRGRLGRSSHSGVKDLSHWRRSSQSEVSSHQKRSRLLQSQEKTSDIRSSSNQFQTYFRTLARDVVKKLGHRGLDKALLEDTYTNDKSLPVGFSQHLNKLSMTQTGEEDPGPLETSRNLRNNSYRQKRSSDSIGRSL